MFALNAPGHVLRASVRACVFCPPLSLSASRQQSARFPCCHNCVFSVQTHTHTHTHHIHSLISDALPPLAPVHTAPHTLQVICFR